MCWPTRFRLKFGALAVLLWLVCGAGAQTLYAQTADDIGLDSDDPVQLYKQAQTAQARNQLERAVALYNAALKLRPEYPDAAYELGSVLLDLKRYAEAEQALRRAAELRAEWSLPQTALGILFVQQQRDKEAEPFLRRALELDSYDQTALIALALLRLRAGDKQDALDIYKRATAAEDATADIWAARASLERDMGDAKSAAQSVKRALQIDSDNVLAHETRAELRAANHDYAHAIEDLEFLLQHQPQAPHAKDWQQMIARFQALAKLSGPPADTRPPSNTTQSTVAVDPAKVDAANSDDPKVARPALLAILQADPKNAGAHARLCALERQSDPQSALEHCRAALELEPQNANYATGFAAALVQARRFADAVVILRKVLAIAPDNYAAHANLATALDELKQYEAALAEYKWVSQAKSDNVIVYYFIGRDLDLLNEFQDALAAYQTFLARADAQLHKDEIERVNLRLPQLRNEIAHGHKGRKH